MVALMRLSSSYCFAYLLATVQLIGEVRARKQLKLEDVHEELRINNKLASEDFINKHISVVRINSKTGERQHEGQRISNARTNNPTFQSPNSVIIIRDKADLNKLKEQFNRAIHGSLYGNNSRGGIGFYKTTAKFKIEYYKSATITNPNKLEHIKSNYFNKERQFVFKVNTLGGHNVVLHYEEDCSLVHEINANRDFYCTLAKNDGRYYSCAPRELGHPNSKDPFDKFYPGTTGKY